MKLSPKELAKLLYLSAKDKSDKDAVAAVRAFVALAKKKGLAPLLPSVQSKLKAAADSIDKTEALTIESARELSAGEASEICRALGVGAGADVLLCVKPSLIAGVRITKGDTVIDATVRARLESFKTAFRSS